MSGNGRKRCDFEGSQRGRDDSTCLFDSKVVGKTGRRAIYAEDKDEMYFSTYPSLRRTLTPGCTELGPDQAAEGSSAPAESSVLIRPAFVRRAHEWMSYTLTSNDSRLDIKVSLFAPRMDVVHPETELIPRELVTQKRKVTHVVWDAYRRIWIDARHCG